jgi:hypothetical protein
MKSIPTPATATQAPEITRHNSRSHRYGSVMRGWFFSFRQNKSNAAMAGAVKLYSNYFPKKQSVTYSRLSPLRDVSPRVPVYGR